LFLLDGMALVYRAHFAMMNAPMRNTKGINVSAVHGFLSTLLAIKNKTRPTHLAVAFDTSEPTQRHLEYPPYKAQRESMPEELSLQIPIVINFLEALNIPILRYDGYEADDVIGTLAMQAGKQQDFTTYMVTPDKDFCQLVNEKVFVWKPGRKGSDYEILDTARVLEDWQVQQTSQVIDILALMGDSSDNVPGVPGIGEKTAKKLIGEYHSVENLLASTAKLKGKLQQNLIEHAEQARLCKWLVTINTEVPLQHKLQDLVIAEADAGKLAGLCEAMNFKSLKDRLLEGFAAGQFAEQFSLSSDFDEPAAPASKEQEAEQQSDDDLFAAVQLADINSSPHQYEICHDSARQQHLQEQLLQAERFCFDLETTGLDESSCEVLGLAFSINPQQAYYVPIKQAGELAAWQAAFDSKALKIGHNLKYDLLVLRWQGIKVQGPFFDTMLAHALLSPGIGQSMDNLAEKYLQYRTIKLQDIAEGKGKNLDVAAVDTEVLGNYACEDADITLQLYHLLAPLIEQKQLQQVCYEIEMPLIEVLVDMQHAGISLDPQVLQMASTEAGEELLQLEQQIYHLADEQFNLNSPSQLGVILFDKLRLLNKPKKTKTGKYVTDEASLQELVHAHPIVDLILRWRELNKLKSTYLDALPRHINPRDARIHTSYQQLVTVTGRLASSNPNLQNIPIKTAAGRNIRRAFVAKNSDYVLISADYSQIELRVMAAIANDKAMLDAFRQGRDIHRETAASLYQIAQDEVSEEMRRQAKTVNFSIIYGVSAFGLAQRLGVSRQLAARFIDAYFATYSGVREWIEELTRSAADKGYVTTLCGRRRELAELSSQNKTIRQGAERQAINTPIQGTAADMMKLAMLRISECIKQQRFDARLLLQIHDEVIVEVHKSQAEELRKLIVECMQQALQLPHGMPVAVEAKCADNWAEAH